MHTGIYLDFTIANQSWCHPYEKNFTTLRLILYASVGLKKNKKYILAQSVH